MGMASSRRDAAVIQPGHTWIVKAWKWGAGSLSAGAALVSILSSVRSITGGQQVRWIGVAPAADTAWSLGDTIQLATTLTDVHGGVLPGVSVGWTSTDTSVASVDSSGTVIARSGGTTTIVAAAGGRIAQARILVRPRPAAIRIFGDTLLRVPEGSATRLVARVVDARRHTVPGQSIAWRSADPSVAAVDSTARLSAVSSGRATLIASSGDITAELPLEVYPVPSTLTLLAGDGQHAPAAHRLPGPVKAQVVSRGGRPMAGVVVRFGVTEGAGRVDQETDTSNTDGIVQAGWTLGGRPGRQRIQLGVDGDGSIATVVVADADPVAENTKIALIGNLPTGPAAETLPDAIGIRVTDSLGAPVADVPVTWEADGGGSITGEASRTDSIGEATARWTLGPRSGMQQAYAQVGSSRAVPRFALRAAALPGPATALAVVRSAPLRGEAGQPLPAAVALRLSDRAGNPVPGISVTVRPSSGSVSLRAPVTDSSGRVAVVWTLGPTAGPQRLLASAPGVERPVEFTALARPGKPDKVVLEGLPPSATAGRTLAQPVAVVVSDGYGNAVSGALVVFASRSGKVTPSRARTDSTGRATARWLLGAAPGEQQLEATVGGRRAVGKVRAVSAKAGRGKR
jgi:Big-like domain-containing protein